MADITVTPALVNTPNTFESVRGVLDEAATPGDAVYRTATGWAKARSNALGTAHARGIVVSDNFGSVAFAAGQTVDIIRDGKVAGFSGMTPGGVVYVSAATAGKLDQTLPASTNYNSIIGYALDATTLMVEPQATRPTVIS